MAAPAWDNIAAFFDPRDFGTVAVIQFAAGGTRQVNGIFDDPYVGAEIGDHVQDTSGPTLTISEADAAGVKRYDAVTISGVTYDVLTKPKNDGTGMMMMTLAKQ